MSRLVLVLGGVRSGKSRFGQSLAERLGGEDVLFVATAEAGDAEMGRRIEHHRGSRPAAWKTLEQPRGTGRALMTLEPSPPVILVDCLTLLVSNTLLASDGNIEEAERSVTEEVEALVAAARQHDATMIVVSGEVGQGVVPDSSLGRAFRDLLGWANQQFAAEAEETYWMVAGMAVEVKSLATSIEAAAAVTNGTGAKR
ncbi:bifunctional adenosylcobinamide kinase/adenosylcobinamide-phosphate guanylyltransferase [Candidatus Laterigemmans baculatus]|uniref:bifunctional adenosylcobinamide kinase/adenosylcobinamide-phosphate guanylyltransferase n=1 Tax=Candidatus Laterigemmans baculatus TaxID=2770505 RepID=UPI0013D90C61|nr:bifunctional adenosylcobinamide kinase/adenosylcobinamide-phosphate guanylyltransferase [Candidatus Laterigemmans baculatus]